MRKFIRNNIVDVLDTLQDAVKQAQKSKDRDTTYQLLCDCHQGLCSLLSIFEEGFSSERFLEYDAFIKQILELLETMNALSEQGKKTDKVHRIIIKSLKQLQEELNKDSEVKIEIAFMPYKLSMWDSMESIWRAAKNDPHCDCYVVPIPYYEKDKTGKLKELVYEGMAYPEEFGAIHYESYHLERRKPDVIFFHNPYDENNYVTSVHPDYYSKELRKHTETLVYVPYCIHRTVPKSTPSYIYTTMTQIADFAVCQHEEEARVHQSHGMDGKKLLPVGNPKLDDIFYMNENPPKLPEAWESVVEGKKVILLNLSIDYVLNEPVEYIYWFAEQVLKQEDLVLLFRPHPLLMSTFQSMRPHMLQEYLNFLETIKKASNGIIDEEKEIYPAFYYSHGLASTSSSVIANYILTEKPIYIFHFNPLEYNVSTKTFPKISSNTFDFSGCYYQDYEDECLTRWKGKKLNLGQAPGFQKIVEREVDGKMVSFLSWFENGTKEEKYRELHFFPKYDGIYYNNRHFSFKYLYNYRGKENDFGIPLLTSGDFFDILRFGDVDKETRMEKFRSKAVNCDGKNGKRVFNAVIKHSKK